MRLLKTLFKIKQKVETMPDFSSQYRITTKYGKYRIESKRNNGEWTGLTVLMDNIDEARNLRLELINKVRDSWIAENDTQGWTVVE